MDFESNNSKLIKWFKQKLSQSLKEKSQGMKQKFSGWELHRCQKVYTSDNQRTYIELSYNTTLTIKNLFQHQ